VIVLPVVSLDDPRVEVYRSLRRVDSLRKDDHFVCEGARVVKQLLRSGLPVHSLLLDERWLAELGPALEARPEKDLPVYVATKRDLETIIGYSLHQGVMATASVPEAPPLLDVARAAQPHLFVALEGVSGAENVGGLVRSCAGFGATGLILDRASHDPFVRRAARVSMGAIFHLPIWKVESIAPVLDELRAAFATRAVAAHLYDPVVDLDRAELDGNLLVVLGSEATGISDDLVRRCDFAARIPMHENWGCLNVGTAGAVFLWEIARRRRGSSPGAI
jgi:tRNA G18 (ribose-2'-O)-methylase SpoU